MKTSIGLILLVACVTCQAEDNNSREDAGQAIKVVSRRYGNIIPYFPRRCTTRRNDDNQWPGSGSDPWGVGGHRPGGSWSHRPIGSRPSRPTRPRPTRSTTSAPTTQAPTRPSHHGHHGHNDNGYHWPYGHYPLYYGIPYINPYGWGSGHGSKT